MTPLTNGRKEITEAEVNRRGNLIINEYGGINPVFEAFYIRSILFSASRGRSAFERFAEARAAAEPDEDQVSLVHEALGHAASLSRFFWPSKIGNRRSPMLASLKEARAAKLRESFNITDESPLRNRRLRDFLEHFDERLDQYLLKNDTGYFFPDAMVGDGSLAADNRGHLFKVLDPVTSCFVLLGERHDFVGIRNEVYRIHDQAQSMSEDGCRLLKH